MVGGLMTYKPSTNAIDVAESSLPIVSSQFVPIRRSAGSPASGSVAGVSAALTIVGSGAGGGDAYGDFIAVATAASVGDGKGLQDVIYTQIGAGAGFLMKWAVDHTADGLAFCGFCTDTAPNMLRSGMFAAAGGAGVGYDKSLGHTNWQWCSRVSNGGPVTAYVDSGVPIQDQHALVTILDATNTNNIFGTIKDAANATVLATHKFLNSDLPSRISDLQIGAAVATPSSGTPAARALRYYGSYHWRRL